LPHLRITRHNIPWLDLTVHFRLHSQSSPQQPSLSFQAVTFHWLR
jgi:hypothetical protein